MPQASDELRDIIAKLIPPIPGHGNLVDCCDAEKYLCDRGWKEQAGAMFSPKSLQEITGDEFAVMLYLRDEWDYAYGGEIGKTKASLGA